MECPPLFAGILAASTGIFGHGSFLIRRAVELLAAESATK